MDTPTLATIGIILIASAITIIIISFVVTMYTIIRSIKVMRSLEDEDVLDDENTRMSGE